MSTTLIIDGQPVEVTESINAVRTAMNKLADYANNAEPFHAGSFTRASDGHRLLVAVTTTNLLTLVASGPINTKGNS